MIAAGGAAAAAPAVTTGPAQAAIQSPQCQADAGAACLAVSTLLTFSGYHCESDTQNSQPVGWCTGTGTGNYRWVSIGRVWM
ncbi:hypothetical protein [Streptomyces sp. AC555_RSS877]|uniref:hypothetical protein n=1 Tax=Streptomyces sp. AC555_RSS877 TaxID=2823688 RepID=UPI001C25E3CE|nr:hypothetical protein [Streptomyces sp. AC555_RSS877]